VAPMNEHETSNFADQRYYHFVLLREVRTFSLKSYWRMIGDAFAFKMSENWALDPYPLQHRKLRMHASYARGAIAEVMSERGGGRPPFLYDVFAAKIDLRGDSYFLFGFPFAALAMTIMDNLIHKQNLLRYGELLGVDVQKLISIMEEGIQDRFEKLETHVVGVQFVVTDDKSLTAVRLGGDAPLSAQIYVDFLRRKRNAGVFLPDRCVLACEREGDVNNRTNRGVIPRAYRSRVHVDGYGNFKFYAQVGCSNLGLLPYTIGQLRAIACLRKVVTNPLLHRREEDE
jgi:hypothetical protein